MSVAEAEQIFNVPNQLTAVPSGAVDRAVRAGAAANTTWRPWCVFILAASTDWVDGYYARKLRPGDHLGRILDPFVDKVIICGSFIYLGGRRAGSGIVSWMAVVVVARELLVTALRNFLEGEGADFSAVMSGKLKMVLQCVAVGVSLFALTLQPRPPVWLDWLLWISVWSAVALTIYSGLEYIRRAISIVRR